MDAPRKRAIAGGKVTALFAGLMVAGVLSSVWAPVSASAVTFNPELIISDANMRHYDSMTRSQIQGFLETQTGPLKSLIAKDYLGVRRPASEIIWLACRAWKINPKVMLTMLQKEQSLLTRTTLAPNTLSRAVGAGCPDPYTNKYPGFGNQIWHGARLLDGYGEGKNGSTIPLYYPGISVKDIYRTPKVTLYPKNLATYKLFIYNPSIGADPPYGDLSSQALTTSGNANFWLIYRRYFGDTFAMPRMRPVYRFRKRSNGTYIYTSSIVERHKLASSPYSKDWAYKGAGFAWDSSVPTTQSVPVYRFLNLTTRKYSYTARRSVYDYRTSKAGRQTWRYRGVAFRAARKPSPGALKLLRFDSRINGARLYTTSTSFLDRYRSTRALRLKWDYEGVVFYLPRMPDP